MLPQYILIASAVLLAVRAFWKGESMLGFVLLGASVLVSWLILPEARPDWLHW